VSGLGYDPWQWTKEAVGTALARWHEGQQVVADWGLKHGIDLSISRHALNLTITLGALAVIGVFLVVWKKKRDRQLALLAVGDVAGRYSTNAAKRETSDGIFVHLVTGSVLAAVMIFGIGGWAATTELEGAVLGSGTVVVDSNVKKVQHPTGGIVAEIHVKDGDTVRAGDLLLRLDETLTRTNLQIVTGQLDELLIREARLVAERDGDLHVMVPPILQARSSETGLANVLRSEERLFQSRIAGLQGQKSQLRKRLVQLLAEIGGLTGQLSSKGREVVLMKSELDRLRPLEVGKLVPATKMTGSRRDAARLDGEQSQLTATIAQVRGKTAETELQLLQLDQDRLTDVMKELRETQSKKDELLERAVAAQDQLRRTEIRAPQAGTVHQLSVHTIGGVVMQGEPILLIVPEADALVVEARISPSDIDNVRQGQAAFVRFPAFNQRTTPEFVGNITTVSADLTREPSQPQNPPYFLARVAFSESELRKLGSLRLMPGMPAEVHIETPRRTALSYLSKPLTDQIALAFRER
jgi:HlyD family secretion protein